MNGYWQRKFHFQAELPSGKIYKGFINVEADTEADLYSREEIRGEWWAKKVPQGWYGRFFLDGGKRADRRQEPTFAVGEQYVVTHGIFNPPQTFARPNSTAEASAILWHLGPIEIDETPLFSGRLGDCIYGEETHYWKYPSYD